LLLALALALGGPAFSQEKLPESDAGAIRAVIEAQLDAFRQDDAARAFSYASEGIRQAFGTAENFMAMVRRSYPAVYRQRSVEFRDAMRIQGIAVQAVRITDAEGRGWLAVYPMEKQPDGSWRIDGCQLGRLSGQET
jgi:hypothetical protein